MKLISCIIFALVSGVLLVGDAQAATCDIRVKRQERIPVEETLFSSPKYKVCDNLSVVLDDERRVMVLLDSLERKLLEQCQREGVIGCNSDPTQQRIWLRNGVGFSGEVCVYGTKTKFVKYSQEQIRELRCGKISECLEKALNEKDLELFELAQQLEKTMCSGK